MIKLSLHHGLFFIELTTSTETHILHTNCYCTYLNLCRMTCRMLQIFFFILLHVFGRCRETMTGENSRERHPHPTPNVDLELVFRHGIMDRPWLQRKRTDTLTTYNFFFFFNNPPPPPKNPKQNILLP